jgi:SAM-dependent methyltransferase
MIYKLLEFSCFYNAVQWVVGLERMRRFIVSHLIEPELSAVASKARILDYGCGTGVMGAYFCCELYEYAGAEVNNDYLKQARQKQGKFYKIDINDNSIINCPGEWDMVFLIGVIHHLSDLEYANALRVCKSLLKPSGKICALEPYYYQGQSWWKRQIMSMDRGKYIREIAGYTQPITKVGFQKIQTRPIHGLLRLPYEHLWIVAEGSNDNTSC